MRRLDVLDEEIARRAAQTLAVRPAWPCRAGCDDCCRSLAALPSLTGAEWERLEKAIEALPACEREAVARAVEARRGREEARPIECPLLDRSSGLCRVYEARPIACRTYGFYADRDGVLGCSKVAEIATKDPDVVWGHHEMVLRKLAEVASGEVRSLMKWLDARPRLSPATGT